MQVDVGECERSSASTSKSAHGTKMSRLGSDPDSVAPDAVSVTLTNVSRKMDIQSDDVAVCDRRALVTLLAAMFTACISHWFNACSVESFGYYSRHQSSSFTIML